ncbi:serine/threonine-protein kinase [Pseudonocardia sp. DLS-67]
MIGTRFGPYGIDALLGRGGMGEVYRAADTSQGGRVVALKVLTPALSGDPQFAARFRREAEIAARLSDPHVVPIHRYGEIDGRLFLDMRLIDGHDLADALADGAAIDPDRAVAILEQIAGALDAAHADGLVHRDVKPANILLADPGTGRPELAYLLDFGIARATDPGSRTALTRTGAVIGTLAYMAPERFLARQAGPASDVYSLACVLHEMLTGSRPYPGTGFEVQVAGHVHQPPPRPSALRSGLPAALDAVVAGGMAKDPAARYRSAGDLARAARAALAGAGVREVRAALPAVPAAATVVDPPRPATAPPAPVPLAAPTGTGGPAPPRRTRWWVPVAAAFVLVVAVVSTALVVTRPAPGPDVPAPVPPDPVPTDALPSGGPVTERALVGRAAASETPVIADLDGTPVLVAGSVTETRVLDLATGEVIGEPIDHAGLTTATVTRLDGRSVVVGGGVDGVIRVFDLATGKPLPTTLSGHTGSVDAIAIADVDGREVLVSGGADRTIRRWDLAAAAPIGDPITGLEKGVYTLSVVRSAGRSVVLAHGIGSSIRAWDLADGTPVGVPVPTSGSAAPVVVELPSGSALLVDDFIEFHLVDLHSGEPLPGYGFRVESEVVPVVVDGRPLLVEAGHDGVIRLRDLRDGSPVGVPMTGHEGSITALTTTTVGGSTYLLSSSLDRSIRIWDLTTRSGR